jgi:hypothetical protein
MSKAPLLFLALLSGCSWLGERGRDLGDIVRAEGAVGVGLQAGVNAGELLHLGFGSSRRWSAGWAYGIGTAERRTEDHLPLSFVYSLIEPEAEALHSLKLGKKNDILKHRCPAVAPCTLQEGSIRKPTMQFWSLEVNVMALAVGLELGVNPGEFVDFLLGLFGFDIAGDDDPDGRARRRLWIPDSPDIHTDW